YTGVDDYLRPWYIRPQSVLTNVKDTKYHQLSSADAEWTALVPNNGIFYLGPQDRLALVYRFLELHCLEVIRREIIDAFPQGESRECLQLIYQIALCRTELAAVPMLGRELEVKDWAKTNRCVGW
ncbi:hypothetical protein EDB87DRAFT_1536391, partial [Lactarius vividus]